MLSSGGMRTAFRLISQAASHGRSIHIPSNAFGRKVPTGGLSSSKGKGVIDTARNALVQLLYGKNPGPSTNSHVFRRAIHTTQPIRNQFSFPVRHALSTSPMSFARPPVVRRGMTEVGLGTARKFSSTRPIFQNLVQNVPVAGRSMYEMDLDVQKKKARKIVAKRLALDKDTKKNKEKIRSRHSTLEENFNKYFPVESSDNQDISTILTVPLVPFDAPAPDAGIYNDQFFLPFHKTAKTFQAHGKHSLRISSLFRRLDQARVWERGAHYEAFGSSSGSLDDLAPSSALCTSLRIVFDGWTLEMVKGIIGEAGEGWCTIQENRIQSSVSHVGPYSLESSRAPTPAPSFSNVWADTPEFIMPSIDFSSSFLDHTATLSPAVHPLHFEDIALSSGNSTPWMSDIVSLPSTRPGSAFGDYEVEDEWHLESHNQVNYNSYQNEASVAFSAEFMRRSQEMEVWSNF